ncbi:MAG: hypothetical protein AABZ75_02500, partial [candidate division NC10 bacterium]
TRPGRSGAAPGATRGSAAVPGAIRWTSTSAMRPLVVITDPDHPGAAAEGAALAAVLRGER